MPEAFEFLIKFMHRRLNAQEDVSSFDRAVMSILRWYIAFDGTTQDVLLATLDVS